MSEPTTTAGRMLAEEIFTVSLVDGAYNDDILAIEQEARAALRAQLVAKVEGLPLTGVGHDIPRQIVLDIIRGER